MFFDDDIYLLTNRVMVGFFSYMILWNAHMVKRYPATFCLFFCDHCCSLLSETYLTVAGHLSGMKFRAQVKEVIQQTHKVRLVRLAWDDVEKFMFRPGQWVGVYCDDFLGVNNKPLRRAFSIASSPGDPYLELCIARGQHLSKHLQDLGEGAEVNVDGPFGMFWLRPAKKYLFIAGGTGIAPFMPMIREALKAKSEVTLVYSMKSPSDFVYEKELTGLAKEGLNLIPTVTAGLDFAGWQGRRGRVQSFLKDVWAQGLLVYACGPIPMVEAVVKELERLGQPKDQLFVDKWE